MSFNISDQLTIHGITYCIAERPTAPGFPCSRAGIIYQLLPAPTGSAGGGEDAALIPWSSGLTSTSGRGRRPRNGAAIIACRTAWDALSLIVRNMMYARAIAAGAAV